MAITTNATPISFHLLKEKVNVELQNKAALFLEDMEV